MPSPHRNFDLVVVGAGIVGTMTAYLATRLRPDDRVLLVDQGQIGGGATAFSAGFDAPLAPTAVHREFVQRSGRLYDVLRSDMPALPLAPVDVYWVIDRDREAELASMLCGTTLTPASGDDHQLLSGSYPGLVIGGNEAVYRMRTPGYYGSPREVAERMAAAARESGRAECSMGTRIERVTRRDGGYVLHCGDGTVITCARVVLATGPWLRTGPARTATGQLGGQPGGPAGLRVKKVAALHVERIPPPGAPALFFPHDDAFLLPRADERRWVLSFASEEWDCAPDAEQLAITPEDRKRALDVLMRHVPAFAPDVHGGRVWCDGYTQDRAPLVTAAGDGSGVIVAGGCSGSGFRLAPAIAERALHLVDDRPSPAYAVPNQRSSQPGVEQ
jgi:glycine/D-amino acid oxidase-like deaminating enzyme